MLAKFMLPALLAHATTAFASGSPIASSYTAPPTFSADDVLKPYIFVFYISFIVAFVFTPLMRGVAIHWDVIDRPDLQRKMHKSPVAYLGGVAMYLGWLSGLAIAPRLHLHYFDPAMGGPGHLIIPRGILFASFVIIGVGLWDDLRGVNPRMKIFAQLTAGAILLAQGIGINSTRPLFAPVDDRTWMWFHFHLPQWFFISTGCALTLAMVVFCCNAVNLMDGLDGLAGGVTGVIATGFLFLVTYMAMQIGPAEIYSSGLRVVLALALLGGVFAFVPYNFNPASIFMGDTGSMFLGFACALLIIMMSELDTRWLLGSLVMFALPVLDTSLAFARRWVNRRPVFSADKMHFHHQLVMRGMTVRKTVIVSYFLSIGFAILGAAIIYMRTRYAVAIYLVVFGGIIVAAYKMGMVHEKPAVVTGRRPIDSPDNTAQYAVGPVDPSSVLEVREDEKR